MPFNAYSGSEPYIFISYSHADSGMVYPVIGELNKRGVLIWYDEGIEPGTVWPRSIAEKILNCSRFMLFITPSSMKSHHVLQEINFANGKNKLIMPVYLKPAALDAGMEMTLSVFQAVFFYSYKNNEEGFYRQILTALTDSPGREYAETLLDQPFSSVLLLRLDQNGDRSLPTVIHLPESGVFTIGRFDVSLGFKQSDFEFGRETKNVSRRHAVINCTDGVHTITDLGSKAGTWLNGRKIPPDTPQQITPGDRVSFGNAGADYIFEG